MEKDFIFRPIVFLYVSLLFLMLATFESWAQTAPPGCVRGTPALTMTPARQLAFSGETKYYNLNIRNNDSMECPDRQIYMLVHVGNPLMGEVSHPMVSMGPGQAGDVNVWVWSDTQTTDGVHSFLVEALDPQVQEPTNTSQGEYEITGNPGCLNSPPAISINPGIHHTDAGGEVVYQITVSNNDSAVCGATTFDLSTQMPQGLSGQLSQNSLTLAPERSGSLELRVSSDPGLAPGDYQFNFSATDSTLANHSSQSTALLTIDPTEPPTVEPPAIVPPPPVEPPPVEPPVVTPPPPVEPPIVSPPPPIEPPTVEPPTVEPPAVTPPPVVLPPTGTSPIRVRNNRRWIKIKWNRFKLSRRYKCSSARSDDEGDEERCRRPKVRYQVYINGQLNSQTWGRKIKTAVAPGNYEIEVWVVTTDGRRFLWGTKLYQID